MAVIDYPMDLGYGSLVLGSERPRGPHIHRGVYTGKIHASYGGRARYFGTLVTPVSSHDGRSQEAISRMMQALFDSRNQLSLTRPNVGAAGLQILVQPLHITPPARNDRGVWSGWTIEFVEVDTDPPTAPPVMAFPVTCPTIVGLFDIPVGSGMQDAVITIPVTSDIARETRLSLGGSRINRLQVAIVETDAGTDAVTPDDLVSPTVLMVTPQIIGADLVVTITQQITDGKMYTAYARWQRFDDRFCPVGLVGVVGGPLTFPFEFRDSVVGAMDMDRIDFTVVDDNTRALIWLDELAGTVAESDVTLQVFDSTNNSVGVDLTYPYLVNTVFDAGDYYVTVTADDDDTDTSYTLRARTLLGDSLPINVEEHIDERGVKIHPFTLSAEGVVTTWLSGVDPLAAARDVDLFIYQETGGSTTFALSHPFRVDKLLAAGSYYIIIHGADAQVNTDYNLRSEILDHTILPIEDADHINDLDMRLHPFTLATASDVIVTVDGLDTNVARRDLSVFLYPVLGVQIRFANLIPYFFTKSLAAGDYYLLIYGDDGSVNTDYTVRIETPVPADLPLTVNGHIDDVGIRTHPFTVTTAGTVTIALSNLAPVSSQRDLTLQLWATDAAGATAFDLSSPYSIVRQVTAGDYIVVVQGDDGQVDTDYTLNVTIV